MVNKTDKILSYDVVFEEAEEGGYTVTAPSLLGCISEGDTFEQARDNITEAISAYLESISMDKLSVPEEIPHNIFLGRVNVPFNYGFASA